MIKLVKIISTSFDKTKRLLSKFSVMGPDDIQETETAAPFGIDSNPIKDMIAIQVETSVIGETSIIGFINKDCITAIGETRLYSTDSDGQLKIDLHLKNDGTILFGGDSGHLTRYQELKSGFDQLTSDFNNLANAFNAHIHPVPGGSSGIPSVAAVPTSADISGSKINELKTL